MAFLFNFPNPNDCDILNDDSCKDERDSHSLENEFSSNVLSCNIISATNVTVPDTKVSTIKIGPHEIKHISTSPAITNSENENLLLAEEKQLDILPGKYEGGFKIWECSIDLAKFVYENECINAGDKVLELGCGAGLPGLLAYLYGASVTFQDFNAEVLQLVTIPNVMLNSLPDEMTNVYEKCCFISGDWEAMKNKFYSNTSERQMYDLIFTSETIYDKLSQKKLLNLMKCALKPHGAIYLAAKIHYFGVGGGISDFETLVEKDCAFEISTVHTIADGVERRILKIKFKQETS